MLSLPALSLPAASRFRLLFMIAFPSVTGIFALAAAEEPAGSAPRPRPAVKVSMARPRLFLPERLLPPVLARVRGPFARIYLDHVRKDCDKPMDERRIRFTVSNSKQLLARTLALLLCWRIERKEVYKERALAVLRAMLEEGPPADRQQERIRIQAAAIGYDWLHDSLPPPERDTLRDGLCRILREEGEVPGGEREFVSGGSHFTTASMLIARLALWDGSEAAQAELETALEHWEKHLEVTRHVAADGGHHLGWRYGRSYATRVAWVAEALSTATKSDVFREERAWLSQLGFHGVYGLRPDNTYFRVGDTHRGIDLSLEEDLVFYSILASRYRDEHLAWFAHRALDWCRQSRALAFDAQYVLALLFLDPRVPPHRPDDLPRVRAFRSAGNYILRTGWEPADTAVLFRAMPWYHFNHERRDFGSFAIYHQGGLAVHGGAYQTGDASSEYGGPHLRNYAWRTAAHNTITVHDPGERFCAPSGAGANRCEGEDRWSNDGGQKVRSPWNDDVPVPFCQPRNLDEVRDPRFAQGAVPIFDDQPDFTYILADGTKAYRQDKVELFERHFIYLKKVEGWKQPVIVVFDRVVAKRPDFKKAWNLHTVEAPRREGNAFVIENTTRVRFSGEGEARPQDYWHQYSGKLHCETLLPQEASLEFVGGEGREFWVDGRNYPTTIREVDRIIEPGIGRIEVSPSKPSRSDLFLHVLSPTSFSDATPRPGTKLVPIEDAVGLSIANYMLVLPGEAGSKEWTGSISYRVERAGPLIHVVAGLPAAAACSITRDGVHLPGGKIPPNGVLGFRSSRGGEFRIESR